MKRTKQMLGAVSGLALIALSTTPVLAQGTVAGKSITNTVSVAYNVGGFAQTPKTATNTFTVDRKINLTIVESGNIGKTTVSPNQTKAVTQFTLTNLSNDTADFALTAVAATGNDFALSNIKIYSDAALTNEITFLDEVAVDAAGARIVYVAADIPIGATTGQTANVVLSAQAHAAGATGLGAIYTNNTGANTENGVANTPANVDTVLADVASNVGGVTDGANNGRFSAIDGYVVAAAAVTVNKKSRILSDPVGNVFPNAKAVPGAVVEYCIYVANAAGAATATGVNVTDTLPADLEIVANSLFINGSTTGAGAAEYCVTSGTGSGATGGTITNNAAPTADAVAATLTDIGAGVTRTLYFRSTIN